MEIAILVLLAILIASINMLVLPILEKISKSVEEINKSLKNSK